MFILQKAPKVVSAGVASVLRACRFSKHLEFHPLEPCTAAPADDVESEADPFAYCKSTDVAPGACCAKPAKQESSCAKPVEQENGCCPKRAKTEYEGPCC